MADVKTIQRTIANELPRWVDISATSAAIVAEQIVARLPNDWKPDPPCEGCGVAMGLLHMPNCPIMASRKQEEEPS